MKLRFVEIVCLVCLAAFMAFTVAGGRGTDCSAEELAEKILSVQASEGLLKRDAKQIKKAFGIKPEDYGEICFYSSDDVMNVDALLVVKLSDTAADADALMKAVENYVSQKTAIFSGYADEQTERLSSCFLKKRGNCVVFSVCAEPSAVRDTFNSAF